MLIQEFYQKIGGDYEEVIRRMGGSEAFVRKFLLKFPADKNFSELSRFLEIGDFEHAFRAAHTLKGICMNLGLGDLSKTSALLTDMLRDNATPDEASWREQMGHLKEQYECVMASLAELE